MYGGFLVPVTILQNPHAQLCSKARCYSSKLIESGRPRLLANAGSFCG
jgi:hypothetical protein